MNFSICRTCLKTDLIKTGYVKISSQDELNQMTFKDMLEIFMPEMDLDITDGEAVMCLYCSDLLKNAYMFKNLCFKTEEIIYDYYNRCHIKLGKKINLSAVLDKKMIFGCNTISGNASVDLKYIPKVELDNTKSLTSDLTESNQSHLIDLCQSESENEKEEEDEASPKRKMRKRANNVKKNRKIYECSSFKRSYSCDLCEYKAYRLDLLDTHKKKHDHNILRKKEYKCELCEYTTPRKRALDRHLFTHKGKSQHLCEICDKPFAEKYQLKLHVLTHTGQQLPHKCEECGKRYLTKSYLKQHMETRHLHCIDCDKDDCEHLTVSRCYKCDLCESSFSDRRGLEAHSFTHREGELPYKCHHCAFSTAWKGNLKKHMKKKHYNE